MSLGPLELGVAALGIRVSPSLKGDRVTSTNGS